MRHTFYGHFVAGEDAETIRPTLNRLYSFGVKSILDYSAEEDLSEEKAVETEMSYVASALKHNPQSSEHQVIYLFRFFVSLL